MVRLGVSKESIHTVLHVYNHTEFVVAWYCVAYSSQMNCRITITHSLLTLLLNNSALCRQSHPTQWKYVRMIPVSTRSRTGACGVLFDNQL